MLFELGAPVPCKRRSVCALSRGHATRTDHGALRFRPPGVHSCSTWGSKPCRARRRPVKPCTAHHGVLFAVRRTGPTGCGRGVAGSRPRRLQGAVRARFTGSPHAPLPPSPDQRDALEQSLRSPCSSGTGPRHWHSGAALASPGPSAWHLQWRGCLQKQLPKRTHRWPRRGAEEEPCPQRQRAKDRRRPTSGLSSSSARARSAVISSDWVAWNTTPVLSLRGGSSNPQRPFHRRAVVPARVVGTGIGCSTSTCTPRGLSLPVHLP
mmetsp:Transcript_25077/g.73253  ORF Transcript_25077/g.73253 Transcript_25077/m.73253 type:complete len:265 (+) Transcript_25077:254-1048(+)